MSCIVELIASQSGKFNILKTKVLWRNDPSLSYVGHLEGNEYTYL